MSGELEKQWGREQAKDHEELWGERLVWERLRKGGEQVNGSEQALREMLNLP